MLRNYLYALILVLGASPALAGSVTSTNTTRRAVSLDECIQIALQHNLNLQIARYTPVIVRQTLAGSYAYYDPAFSFSAAKAHNTSPGRFDTTLNTVIGSAETWSEAYRSSLGGRLPSGMSYNLSGFEQRTTFNGGPYQHNNSIGLDVSQPLLKNFLIDGGRIQIKINKREVTISELELEYSVMSTVASVQNAYFELIFAKENIKVQEKALELAKRFYEENRTRVRVGTMASLEEKQAQSQVAAASANLISANNRLSEAQNAIINLFTDDYRSWHEVFLEPSDLLLAVPEKIDLFASWESGLTLRPDFLQFREEVEKSNLDLKYRRNQLLPALNLDAGIGRSGVAGTTGTVFESLKANDFPHWSVGGSLSVPLSRTAERSSYKISKAQREQALLRLKQKEQSVIVEIDNAAKSVESNLQAIDARRQATKFAEEALAAEEKKLENGKSTSFTVLQLQRDLTLARFQEISALSDYNKSVSQLHLSEGTTLRRNNIQIEMK